MASPSLTRKRPVLVRTAYGVPRDLAPLLVSVPVWTRDNEYLDAPDTPPSFYANVMLTDRYLSTVGR
jgi:hypothetical protein